MIFLNRICIVFIGFVLAVLAFAQVIQSEEVSFKSSKTGVTEVPTALGVAHNTRPLIIVSIAWVLYSAWELLVQTKTPEANIRIDLIVIWSILAILSAWALFRVFR